MKYVMSLLLLTVWLAGGLIPTATRSATSSASRVEACLRPEEGEVALEPPSLRSTNGVLRAELRYRSSLGKAGHRQYCYLTPDGSEAPTLHVRPGDKVALALRNELAATAEHLQSGMTMDIPDPCASAAMTPLSTNLHFHGLSIPSSCHQDDVLKTMVQPGDPPFEYQFEIPADQPPGLYWYHPHIHGMTSPQVLGGASGAMIVDGIESEVREVAGLPERVFVIRDQDLRNPDAAPIATDSMPAPMVLRDAEGDVLNTGTGAGKPAKDLSINFAPVSYPEYRPAIIRTRPNERQLWRVLNASAITYLDLQVLIGSAPQLVGVVALDGVPINRRGKGADSVLWESHVLMPPGGRAEFIFKGAPENSRASLVTRTVDTGPAGENDPTRPLATIVSSAEAPELRSSLPSSAAAPAVRTDSWIGIVKPVRTRKLYFSETPVDPANPNGPTAFFLTVDGQQPKVFDPASSAPNIVAQQGEVEDWVIENRSQELHAFHIHQIHFMLIDWNGVPVNEPFLRDTINIPYWDGRSPQYPSVRLRMDFRDPNAVGTFPYHCHLLEHEDGGMMGLIRVEPSSSKH